MTSLAADLAGVARLSDRLSAGYLEHHGVLPLERRRGQGAAPPPGSTGPIRRRSTISASSSAASVELIKGEEDDLRAAIRRVYAATPSPPKALIAGLAGDGAAGAAREVPLDDLRRTSPTRRRSSGW